MCPLFHGLKKNTMKKQMTKCNHTILKMTYVLNLVSNKTSIGCFCEKPVAVKYCLEYNINKGVTIIQPKSSSLCKDLSITLVTLSTFLQRATSCLNALRNMVEFPLQ